jgi:hypothetical protein
MRPLILLSLASTFTAILSLTSCVGGKETAPKVYEEGSRVEVGHLIYTVFETQWLPQLGSGDTARMPKNRFLLVRLSAVNSGSEELDIPNISLKDDHGTAVEEMSDGEGVAQWVGYVRKVRPADSLSGNIVFDAEPKHYIMRLTDENGENAAMVDLPLTFSAEAPPTPLQNLANPTGGIDPTGVKK